MLYSTLGLYCIKNVARSLSILPVVWLFSAYSS